MSYHHESDGQLTLLGLGGLEKAAAPPRQKAPARSVPELVAIPYLYLDLSPGHVDLFGNHYWELRSPYREGKPPLNTGPAPREPIHSSLSEILESDPDTRYYLSGKACRGILRRADERGKELPQQLKVALMAQAGLGMPTQAFREMKAYHINQRDEGIDLGGVSGALMATSNMQMQTFITAAFCAGAAPSAGGIGYQEEISPTLKASESGTDQVPSVLCLNDQGGSVMHYSENVTGALRAQEHGHQPLVYENHGIDARYTGPHPVAPTLSARAGTGGNNLPLVEQEALTDTNHHAVFSRQRVDKFAPGDVASTESARQHKDATDLIYQAAGTGPSQLIRRLTPLECERLQGFPDGWTDIPGSSDSARYKALGNSVAIPCVEFIMRGIAAVLRYDR